MGNNSLLCGALEMCEIMAINFFFQICDKDGRAKCRKKWFIPDIIFNRDMHCRRWAQFMLCCLLYRKKCFYCTETKVLSKIKILHGLGFNETAVTKISNDLMLLTGSEMLIMIYT